MRLIHYGPIVALDSWSDLLGCHVGVRADVLRGMPVGIPAWQAKRLLHGALDKAHHLRRFLYASGRACPARAVTALAQVPQLEE